jgi:hypothetical protein
VEILENCAGDLGMIIHAFREESMSHTRVFGCKNPDSLRPRKARQVKGKVKNVLKIFFAIKRIVHKEFDLAGQRVSATYNCYVLW